MMQERARKPGQRFDDQREAAGEIVARPRIKPHALAILAGDDAEAVVLNLVQPRPAGRQLISFDREARCDEAGGKGTRMGEHARINRRRWPRLEGPRRRARYGAGGGGGGFGGLGCSMAMRKVLMSAFSQSASGFD